MSATQETRFHYNAHGHGLSAQFKRPIEQVVDVQAGVSLPVIGGHGSARVDNFKFNEILSFKSAYAHVSGSQDPKDGGFSTLVTATVEGLNILDVVTADRVVARIAAHHVPGADEASIIFLGSKFERLRIAGCDVDVELDPELSYRLETFGAFQSRHAQDAEFRKMLEQRYKWGSKHHPLVAKGFAHCSLVKEVKTDCPCVERLAHHVLRVPHFGKIHLAEVSLKHHERSLTMIRLELGSTPQGLVTAASGSGNGTPYPPLGN
jgi:hypothetical protein